jgi:hypothetical protein
VQKYSVFPSPLAGAAIRMAIKRAIIRIIIRGFRSAMLLPYTLTGYFHRERLSTRYACSEYSWKTTNVATGMRQAVRTWQTIFQFRRRT